MTAVRADARPPRRRRLRPARLVQAAFGAVVLGALFAALVAQYDRTSALARQAIQLEQHRRDLLQQNDRLRTEITRLRTDDAYVELLARQQLGLVRPGEIELLIVRPGSPQAGTDQPNAVHRGTPPRGIAQSSAMRPAGRPDGAVKALERAGADLRRTWADGRWLNGIRPILGQMFGWLHRHMPMW